MARGLTRGDVRLVKLGAPDKMRPAVVLTRASALAYLDRITIAPVTTTIRDVPSEVLLGPDDGMKTPCVVNLHHVMTVPRKALGRWVATLTPERTDDVCRALAFALGCDD